MSGVLSLSRDLDNVLLTKSNKSVLKQLLITVVASLAIAISAKTAIILQPVPITLQTFAVLAITMIFGWRIGVSAVALYLLEGALGLPVFAPSNPSMAAFFGPTGGYLFGFLPAALVTGLLVEKGWATHRVTVALAAVIGMAIIYLCGLLWLSNFVSFPLAISTGLKPFLLADALKVVALTILIPLFWRSKN